MRTEDRAGARPVAGRRPVKRCLEEVGHDEFEMRWIDRNLGRSVEGGRTLKTNALLVEKRGRCFKHAAENGVGVCTSVR